MRVKCYKAGLNCSCQWQQGTLFFLESSSGCLFSPPLHSYCSGPHLSISFIYFKPQTQSLSKFSQICFIKEQPTVAINRLSIQHNYFQETGYWLEISSCECEMLLSTDENCSCSLELLLWAEQLQLLLDAATAPSSTTGAGHWEGSSCCGRDVKEPFWKVVRHSDNMKKVDF